MACDEFDAEVLRRIIGLVWMLKDQVEKVDENLVEKRGCTLSIWVD